MSKKNYDGKHLTTTHRIKIEKGLLDGESFASIARMIEKHPSTVAKEVKKYRYFPERENPSKKLPCIKKSNCAIHFLCEKTQDCVLEVFDTISEKLGLQAFRELFPVILTDNGVEFQSPERLEHDAGAQKRTSIYYCNPNSSWQKGMLEKNHEYIRYVIPKGQSLDRYSQAGAVTLMNHINSEARDSLNGSTPFKLSLLLLNNKLHQLLRLVEIPPDEVTLHPSLLKK